MIAFAMGGEVAVDGGCAGAGEHSALRLFEVEDGAGGEAGIRKLQKLHPVRGGRRWSCWWFRSRFQGSGLNWGPLKT